MGDVGAPGETGGEGLPGSDGALGPRGVAGKQGELGGFVSVIECFVLLKRILLLRYFVTKIYNYNIMQFI